MRPPFALLALLVAVFVSSSVASAQSTSNAARPEPDGGASATATTSRMDMEAASESAGSASTAAATQGATEDDDMVLDPAQPDFTVVNLPTSLRLPKHRLAFRVTHRFNRPLGVGDFGDLVEDLFGFDGGALIGLELRFGLWDGWQTGIYRTSNRTIQMFTQYNMVRQNRGGPLSIDAWFSVEGLDNFRVQHAPALGAIFSRTFAEHGAIHVSPVWIWNTNVFPAGDEDDGTLLIGLGGRVRIRPTVYLVGEFVPRVAGFDPADHQIAFGIEKRLGGHAFQVNFSNALGSTMGQMARSFANNDDWFIGFNISRKFY